MRIGPIGSNPFTDLYRLTQTGANQASPQKNAANVKKVISEDNRNLNYLERQARNAQRQDLSLEQSSFDVSL